MTSLLLKTIKFYFTIIVVPIFFFVSCGGGETGVTGGLANKNTNTNQPSKTQDITCVPGTTCSTEVSANIQKYNTCVPGIVCQKNNTNTNTNTKNNTKINTNTNTKNNNNSKKNSCLPGQICK